jgi:hypothetical protein
MNIVKILASLGIISLIVIVSFAYINTASQEDNLCNKDYVMISLAYDGNFSVLDKTLERGCVPLILHNANFEYSYELTGSNTSLYQQDFNPTLIFSDNDEQGDVREANQSFDIAVPSLKQGEKVNLYDNESKILEIDVYNVGAKSCRIE